MLEVPELEGVLAGIAQAVPLKMVPVAQVVQIDPELQRVQLAIQAEQAVPEE